MRVRVGMVGRRLLGRVRAEPRLRGIFPTNFCPASEPKKAELSSVSMYPGWSALTRMECRAHSRAMLRVMWSTDALLIPYVDRRPAHTRGAPEA